MSRKRWMIFGGLALTAVVLSSVAWSLRDEYTMASLVTGYTAKQTCSCVSVSGRSLESCIAELPQEARDNVTITQEGASVRASVLFGAVSAEASYEPEYGCSFSG